MPHGRATVTIAPDEKTYQVSIIDRAGRTVMNALMSGPAATTPKQLLDWTCKYDQTYALGGTDFGAGGTDFGAMAFRCHAPDDFVHLTISCT